MTQQLEMFSEYAFRIEKAQQKPYFYDVYCGEKFLCSFMGLDMACAYIRHSLRAMFVPYKRTMEIMNKALEDYRQKEDTEVSKTRPLE